MKAPGPLPVCLHACILFISFIPYLIAYNEVLTIASMLSGRWAHGATMSFCALVFTRSPGWHAEAEAEAGKARFAVSESDHLTLLNNNYMHSKPMPRAYEHGLKIHKMEKHDIDLVTTIAKALQQYSEILGSTKY
ncbi:uncharacterized protein EI90DRAFT_3014624 [Cantharellus anzutake]|uniref:uncharacterized protein n=1 Tax=Cantharellus anzutake TaxID=1750568 RepID=UPI00190342A5|nr:uncharacterized protein EI90DRAFT_3014624 [Cantharellus anzutake]KAF8335365.1 hypothetical protein EI90DRAFT_3014624 [Cantharellus anzutake]